MINSIEKLKNMMASADTVTPSHRDSNVLIIDGLNTFIRVFAAVPALNDDGDHVGGVVGVLKSIGANIRQFNATRCILVFDGKGGSARRRKVYPDYKGNRKNKNTFNRFKEFEAPENEAESFKIQFQRLIKYFATLPLTLLSIDNIEADDVIAYIAKQYYKGVDNKITIVSTDRDFLQLVNDQINVWSPTKKKLYNKERMLEEYGIPVENYLLYRMCSGDASDNIPGIKGVGLKTLIKRFPNIITEDLSAEQLIRAAQEQIDDGSKLKIVNEIVSNKDILLRNFTLMQLAEVNIAGTFKDAIRDICDSQIPRLDRREFRRLFLEDKLYANIKNIDNWLRNTWNRLDIFANDN